MVRDAVDVVWTAQGPRVLEINSGVMIESLSRRFPDIARQVYTRALDRVLLAHDFIVPQWTYGFSRTARWNRFSHPDKMPEYGASAFPTIWWYDEAKAKETDAKN